MNSVAVITMVASTVAACGGSVNGDGDRDPTGEEELYCSSDGTGNPSIDGLLESSRHLIDTLANLRAQIEASVAVTEQTLGITPAGSLFVRLEVLVAAIAADVEIHSGQPLTVFLPRPTCTSDRGAMEEAYAVCLAWHGCEGDLEIPAACSGNCLGACVGDCDGSALCRRPSEDEACAGTCSGSCDLQLADDCLGVCLGECSGPCTVYDKDAECMGYCEGQCSGTCVQSEDAICSGTCAGSCTDASETCDDEVACDGTCQGECQDECQGAWEPDLLDCDSAPGCIPQAKAASLANYDCISLPIEFSFIEREDDPDRVAYSLRMREVETQLEILYRIFNLYAAITQGTESGALVVEPPPLLALADLIAEAGKDTVDNPVLRLASGVEAECARPLLSAEYTALSEETRVAAPYLHYLSTFVEAGRNGFAPET